MGKVQPAQADSELLSVAGLVGAKVEDSSMHRAGVVIDVLVALEDPYPPLVGVLARHLRGHTFIVHNVLTAVAQRSVRLSGRLEHRAVPSETDLVFLVRDVLDRQIVDVDGSNVFRVSDLVLGRVDDRLRLTGADVSMRTLLRRLGPSALRRRVAPNRVLDWSSVGAFSQRGDDGDDSVLRLTTASTDLRGHAHLDLARILGKLPAHERSVLASHLRGGT